MCSLRYQYFRAGVLAVLDENQQKGEPQVTEGEDSQDYKRGYEDAIADFCRMLPDNVLRDIARGKCEPQRTEKQGLMLLAGLTEAE